MINDGGRRATCWTHSPRALRTFGHASWSMTVVAAHTLSTLPAEGAKIYVYASNNTEQTPCRRREDFCIHDGTPGTHSPPDWRRFYETTPGDINSLNLSRASIW